MPVLLSLMAKHTHMSGQGGLRHKQTPVMKISECTVSQKKSPQRTGAPTSKTRSKAAKGAGAGAKPAKCQKQKLGERPTGRTPLAEREGNQDRWPKKSWTEKELMQKQCWNLNWGGRITWQKTKKHAQTYRQFPKVKYKEG